MSFRLHVDAKVSTAPFEQVRQQLDTAIAQGLLAPGQRLPTVRALAAELALAPNTVARAYRELEQGGRIVTRGRSGTYVAARDEAAHRRVTEAAAEFSAVVRRSGVDPAEALRVVRRLLAE
jgi:DNA-binding transcriptional regulator YhcF (GntR family)